MFVILPESLSRIGAEISEMMGENEMNFTDLKELRRYILFSEARAGR